MRLVKYKLQFLEKKIHKSTTCLEYLLTARSNMKTLLILKLLFILFISTFVSFFHYLFYKESSGSLTMQSRNPYHFSYYRFPYENISISADIKVIPIPRTIRSRNAILIISNGVKIMSKSKSSNDLESTIDRYSKYISVLTGISMQNNQNKSSLKTKLILDCRFEDSNVDSYPTLNEDESYTLNVTQTGVYLTGLTLTGIVRGLATFIQLIERNTSLQISYVPIVTIIDRPQYPWRGLMLDVSRHWMPVSVIERTLNAMELSKLNVLHLHLTDDHGFRVESIQYNLLHDRNHFFTQKDIKHIVEYARQRRIRVVPEFDIPAHTTR